MIVEEQLGPLVPGPEEDFLPAYKAGHKLHSLEYKVNKTARQIAYREREIERMDRLMDHQQEIVISDDATVQQRVKALLEAKEISEKQDAFQQQIAILERNKVRYEVELENYRTTVVHNF